ncbi:MAG: DUF3575 domain-containing protein [Bacteroidota bacterium]|jgi:hypothetical protein|uniref:DUF3575 domain-containing protein n=1 Tax=Candidatus Pollutiaquabacter sp. TaxID=3416354 RepID=UPI001B4903FB|nr:DUF3575 domain-containing protein [Bacteroidota bacterium]MBP7268817.1 DUF3575 domain-containing protein [Bacteroidia bacterium]MBP7436564.1 DUF3575 domain-containing protein [Bacteroidia bacterium]MBP7728655.1 DUF3575 domain-containing protein [Bacteroidia bacterium]MBP7772488.1 DUF3575 domain-containing protein [Bacteroidia bacterium]
MKHSPRILVWALSLLLTIPAFGQTEVVPLVGKNVVKFNLTSTALSHYAIQYEYVTNPRQSVGFGFGISPDVALPFKDNLLDQFGDDDDARRAIESTRFTKYTFTPEYRFYVGKKSAPEGFYVATFMRYTHMSMSQVYSFTTSAGKLHTPVVDGTFNGFGAGAMIGTQWLFGKTKNLALDLWIVGPFAGIMKAKFHGTDDMSDMTQQDKIDLKEDIESIEIPLWTTEATIGNNEIDVDMNGPFYGVRMLGLSFGVRF